MACPCLITLWALKTVRLGHYLKFYNVVEVIKWNEKCSERKKSDKILYSSLQSLSYRNCKIVETKIRFHCFRYIKITVTIVRFPREEKVPSLRSHAILTWKQHYIDVSDISWSRTLRWRFLTIIISQTSLAIAVKSSILNVGRRLNIEDFWLIKRREEVCF